MNKARQGGLGKGLGSLIPSEPKEIGGPLRELPVGSIVPNTFQPRRHFDEEDLVSLTSSIRELGVLQPILVRDRGDDTFELIAGERRWRAATRAGLDRIPAVIRNVDDETSLAHAIVENVQRAELNAIEEAAAFKQLIEEFSLTQDQVAKRVGRSRPAIANALRLLTLPDGLQRHIIEGTLTAGHGRVLVSVDAGERDALAKQVIAEGLSVRALEALARGEVESDSDLESDPNETSADTPAGQGTSGPIGATKPAALLELEDLLEDHFSTKVVIRMGSGNGTVQISFADIDDLERIYGLMGSE